ncbi:MAG: hypothetical protein FJ086_05050 [Deltaproteobacteria bacterium]|nr:hypothetical protein [Deltaproteobacteria bacterium]
MRPAAALLAAWLCAALLCLPAWAQDAGAPAEAVPLAAVARVEPEKVQLGEPFTVTLTVRHPAGERYELESPGDLGAFEFLGQERARTDADDGATTTFHLKLQLFELGLQELPPLGFAVSTPDGPRRYVHRGMQVEAVPLIPDDAQGAAAELRDIKPPEDVPVRSWALLYGLAAAAAAAAAAWAAWRWWKNRPRIPVAPVLPPRPLEERTLAALDALRAERLVEAGRTREFYFKLSAILRGYLGERYGFEALECTSPELLARARGLNAPGLSYEALCRFVEDSDQARYARAELPADTCLSGLQYATQLVRDTTPHAPRPPVP